MPRAAPRGGGEILLAAILVQACGWPSAQERFPPPTETLRITGTVPANGEDNVGAKTAVDICFSGLVDPRTLDDFDALIGSGRRLFDTQAELQLVPWRGAGGTPAGPDPWCPGSVLTITPQGELQGGILYRLQMRPFAIGWGGEQLDTEGPGWVLNESGDPRFVVEFTTATSAGDDTSTSTGDTGTSTGDTGTGTGDTGTDDTGTSTGDTGDEPEPATVRLDDLFKDGRIFDPTANYCRCHRDDGPPEHDVAQARVNLTTPESAYRDLVEAQGVRETGFPMVAPRRPSESYLLHKLLRRPDGRPLHGILGDAMPLGDELPYSAFVDLAHWIEGGAEP